ncbi:dynamin family protein [Sporosarcina aquimarina]|uniref:Dynamin family protein n=1 Tax=Sporosarcina aquimarina TaxID=114975 RepID=A0ABU4FWF5_9BACL|nr:dynamin family protein [Sporosarcina aquimarina]MDW0109039.1 dynamin family protein [Sporosarcina aquimarina]
MMEQAIVEGIELLMTQHTDFLNETALLGLLCKEDGDQERFQKATLLAQKIVKDEYTIAFAGHFSAGKSSMINALTGDELLPSSPIPTSANIVKVHKDDEDFAIVHRQDGTSVKVIGEGFSQAVKKMSKEGTSIASLEIGHTQSNLPKGISVMDTPGVDSTDDAHRLSTESALHLADIVFYTMDYNHVQSELNFRFTKELMRYNPNVYLLVNQIDKHRANELSFDDFKESVRHSFSLWGVEPKGIFFTSLKDRDIEHNDFNAVQDIVNNSIQHRNEHFEQNTKNALNQLTAEHIDFLKEEIRDTKESHPEISESEWLDYHELKEETGELEKRLSLLQGDAFHLHFEQERKELLQSASLTPYEIRDLLKEYLESQTSHFKVGLFFSSKKTEEERQRRFQALSEPLEKLAHTQIEIHLRSLMKKVLKQAGLLSDERSLEIDEMDLAFRFDEVAFALSTPDILTGELILNAASQMREAVLTVYKRKTDDWKNKLAEIAKNEGKLKEEKLRKDLEEAESKLCVINLLNSRSEHLLLFESEQEQIQELSPEEIKAIDELKKEWRVQIEPEILNVEHQIEEEIQRNNIAEEKDAADPIDDVFEGNQELVIKRAHRIADEVEHIPGFNDLSAYLRSKSDRLEQQEFTVALFGAFSAGKSSFSNALLGEAVLPVSPNPTTAAINRIRPVSDIHQDRTADIHFKTHEHLAQDTKEAFAMLGLTIDTLEDAYNRSEEALQMKLVEESLHIHKSFIRAFHAGYPTYKDLLGTVLTAEREEFVRFVAEEERSCFVESIDFYYDCELTRQGITLVDTPGADSINARHTDVAFEYIRNADAILFITYYNHAFSRADREFLIQLGRVKDAFEMDKMFFVVNAIDLAANEEEAEEVKGFVSEELVKFGIRNPRVQGISSLQALEAKRQGLTEQRMEDFENRFYSFLENDLNALAVQALDEEATKTIQRLADLIERTEKNRERKAERLEDLDNYEQRATEHYSTSFALVLRKAAQEELRELIFYIHQRVFLRFPDFFKEAYTPSLFVRHQASEALRLALEETLDMTGFDFAQELKVTNLRMLTFMKKQVAARQKLEQRWLAEMDNALSPSPFDSSDADMLTFSAPFQQSDRYRQVNRHFKNAKSFFEKGDRNALQEQLTELLKKDASDYLEIEQERLGAWTNQWIDNTANELTEHLLRETLSQINAERNLLESHEQLSEWRLVYEQLHQKELV